jgi:hypothetical protein
MEIDQRPVRMLWALIGVTVPLMDLNCCVWHKKPLNEGQSMSINRGLLVHIATQFLTNKWQNRICQSTIDKRVVALIRMVGGAGGKCSMITMKTYIIVIPGFA